MQKLHVKNTSTWLLNNRSAKYVIPLAMSHIKNQTGLSWDMGSPSLPCPDTQCSMKVTAHH